MAFPGHGVKSPLHDSDSLRGDVSRCAACLLLKVTLLPSPFDAVELLADARAQQHDLAEDDYCREDQRYHKVWRSVKAVALLFEGSFPAIY